MSANSNTSHRDIVVLARPGSLKNYSSLPQATSTPYGEGLRQAVGLIHGELLMAAHLQHEAMAEVCAEKVIEWQEACREFEKVARDH